MKETTTISCIWIGDGEDPVGGCNLSDASIWTQEDQVEGLIVRLSPRQGGPSIEIGRTYAGTCPIYVSSVGRTLYLSWQYEKTVEPLSRRIPNIDACRIFLSEGTGQVREQVISGTYMLWPGERLIFDETGGIRFFVASDRPILSATPVRNEARVCDHFFELVQTTMDRYLKRSTKPLVELSGGLDSSTLGLAAGEFAQTIYSYGLIQEGVMGLQQRERRREIITHSKLEDYEHPAHCIPPFAGLDSLAECSYTAFDDNHRPACATAIDDHPAGPFDTIFTGIGGDELMLEHSYTRAEWEVPGTICRSSLVAASARADMFLRRGIWPISPFCDFAIIDFCRALPAIYRQNRTLIRMNFARRGISDGFIFPRYDEHYGHTMRHEMATIDFDDMVANSLVASLNIAGLSSLLDEARNAHYGGFSYRLMAGMWRFAKLDKVLSRYLN